MKKNILFILTVIYTSLSFGQNNDLVTFYNKADDFFSANVKNGLVKYSDLSKDSKDLQELIDMSNTIQVDKSDAANFKAFWINVYNLGVISAVLEKYPVKSPQEISGFFVDNKYMLGGKLTTFDKIENEYLRGNFNEPRFHFVLVCGAVSCPPIVNYAYRPSMLDLQLDAQTRSAMNDDNFLMVDDLTKTVKFSQIFDWYSKDFKNTGLTNIQYANKYRTKKIPESYKSSYYTYNWTLNDIKGNWIEQSSEQQISNIRAFTPSSLLKKGQWDFKVFNNFYTQTRSITDKGTVSRDERRQNYFTSTFEISHGISRNAKINVGIIAQVKTNTYDGQGALDVFKFDSDLNRAKSGLASLAPTVKISPLSSVSNFSIQSSFYIPVFKEENVGYLDRRSNVWETRFFYDYSFGQDKFQAFAEIDFAYAFGEHKDDASANENSGERFANNSLSMPVSLFLSYFPSDKFTVYINGQYSKLFDLGADFSQRYHSAGLGMKYQATKDLNIEISHGYFLGGRSTGLGETYNLGLRYIL